MAELPRKKLPTSIKGGNRYGISLGSIDTFLKDRAFDGSKDPEDDTLRLSLGMIEGTPHERSQLGPIFVEFVLQRTMQTAPLTEAPGLVDRASKVKDKLKELLEKRSTGQQDGTLGAYNVQRREYMQVAREQRGNDIFADASIVTADTLKNHGAHELATDVVAALGALAQQGVQEEIETATDIISHHETGSQLST